MTKVVPALPAATVTLVRDTAAGIEVLMLQRNLQSGFMPGMFLFPGGGLDPEDQAEAVLGRCTGLTDQAASATLGLSSGGLAYWAAAIRESFEEASVLLAYDESGTLVNPRTEQRLARFEDYRRRLNAGEPVLASMLARENLTLAVERLTYFSHWITPVGAPRRYDTRFFVAVAPHDQEALPDNVEAIHHVWVNPGQAVDRYRSGEYKMRTPTIRTLERFAEFATTGSLIEWLRAQQTIPAMQPRIGKNGERVLPGEPGYDALAAVEEQGKWTT
jgi:8-oxo-dGTP pyrophosphatase MutT (NUDIX family)